MPSASQTPILGTSLDTHYTKASINARHTASPISESLYQWTNQRRQVHLTPDITVRQCCKCNQYTCNIKRTHSAPAKPQTMQPHPEQQRKRRLYTFLQSEILMRGVLLHISKASADTQETPRHFDHRGYPLTILLNQNVQRPRQKLPAAFHRTVLIPTGFEHRIHRDHE